MAMWTFGVRRFLQDEEWMTLRMLIPFFFEFKYRFIFAIACVGVIQLINLATPYLLGRIVDALDITKVNYLTVPAILLGSYVFIRFLGGAVREIQMAVYGMVSVRTTKNLSLTLLKHLHSLDFDYHLSRKTGGLTRDMDRGIHAITGLMELFSLQLVSMFMGFAMITVVFMAWFDWRYALIVATCVILYATYTVKVTAWRTPIIRASNNAHSKAHTRAVDSLINHENVKIFGNEYLEYEYYDQELGIWEKARTKNRLSLAALNIGQSFVVHLGLLGMLAIAVNSVVAGDLSLGELVQINGYAIQVFGPLGALGSIYRRLKQSFTDVENMLAILLEKPSIMSPEESVVSRRNLQTRSGPIVFDDVHFSYKADRPILKGISFRVEPGERVAMVGPSGSGKSTIGRLLFRLYDPDSGSISVNGFDLRKHDLDVLRSSIGVVPQDTTLFNSTLEDNIRYGKENASREEIMRAVHMAHLSSFVAQLPDGLDTIVGERGLKLSGGEKQRVAIARTMLKNPTYLLFDEATSSLDTATEGAIMYAIDEVSQGHTTLIIAHRLSTVIDADRILVLVDGTIEESGTHQELLELDGVYNRLWLLQQREISFREAQQALQVSGYS